MSKVFSIAGEDLRAGDFITFQRIDDEILVYRAIAKTTNKPAMGFVTTKAKKGDKVAVSREGVNNKLKFLKPNQPYYLSNTLPGAATQTPPRYRNNIVQYLGVSISSTGLLIEQINDYVVND